MPSLNPKSQIETIQCLGFSFGESFDRVRGFRATSSTDSLSSLFLLHFLSSAKLLAAAEKYGLPRLKLMCESVLCKDISIDSVAYILALADRYRATELRSVSVYNFLLKTLLSIKDWTPIIRKNKTP